VTHRILLDLNVVLDVLLDRAPFADASATLWASIESGEAEGFIAAHAVTTLHYLAARGRNRALADRCVTEVLSVFEVAPVDGAVLVAATALGWPDFEDAVVAAAAHASGCTMIATRDPRGFRGAPCLAVAPLEALAVVRAGR
jgi:predicted nucleic acid-binding protein